MRSTQGRIEHSNIYSRALNSIGYPLLYKVSCRHPEQNCKVKLFIWRPCRNEDRLAVVLGNPVPAAQRVLGNPPSTRQIAPVLKSKEQGGREINRFGRFALPPLVRTYSIEQYDSATDKQDAGLKP